MPSLMPIEPARSKIIELKETQDMEAEVLAERAKVSIDTIHKILYDPRPTVEFDVVDRLFCALRVPMWGRHVYEDLKELYESVDLSGPSIYKPRRETKRRCRHPGCSKMFVPNKHHKRGKTAQVYCSVYCRQAHWRERNGLQNSRSEQMDFMCRNKHVRTPENTKIRPNGTRVCRACIRESDRVRRLNKREAMAA